MKQDPTGFSQLRTLVEKSKELNIKVINVSDLQELTENPNIESAELVTFINNHDVARMVTLKKMKLIILRNLQSRRII